MFYEILSNFLNFELFFFEKMEVSKSILQSKKFTEKFF